MNTYRIDFVSDRSSSRLWVDCPNMVCAIVVGWWQGRRHHRQVSRKPCRSFTVTRED